MVIFFSLILSMNEIVESYSPNPMEKVYMNSVLIGGCLKATLEFGQVDGAI